MGFFNSWDVLLLLFSGQVFSSLSFFLNLKKEDEWHHSFFSGVKEITQPNILPFFAPQHSYRSSTLSVALRLSNACLGLSFLDQTPDEPFHNFIASRSGDRRTFSNSAQDRRATDFEAPKLWKCSSGISSNWNLWSTSMTEKVASYKKKLGFLAVIFYSPVPTLATQREMFSRAVSSFCKPD